jgi:hypothetical protein
MADATSSGFLRRILFGPWGLRFGWRLLIFNVTFNLFGVLMKLILVPVVGKEPEWTAANFILIEAVSLAGSAACVYLMVKIERRRFADYGFTRRGALGRLPFRFAPGRDRLPRLRALHPGFRDPFLAGRGRPVRAFRILSPLRPET